MTTTPVDEGSLPQNLRRPLSAWFPDAVTAGTCLGLLAHLIEQAHALGPARWVLTFRDRSILTLSVGALLILRFYDDGRVSVALEDLAHGDELPSLLGNAILQHTVRFAKAPNVMLVELPSSTLAGILPKLQISIESALALGSQTVRHRSPFFRRHSAEAVQWIATAVGRDLPVANHTEVVSEDIGSDQSEDTRKPDRWSETSLEQAWSKYAGQPSAWTENAYKIAEKMRGAPTDQFRSREFQQALWSAQAFASAGPGHAIDVSIAYGDGEVLERLDALRHRVWPADTVDCANALQKEFNAVMARLVALKVKVRPWAKLLRVFSILAPQHLTCLLQYEARAKAVRRLFGRERPGNAIEEQVRIRAKLRDVLGEETDLREHASRITFCWSLQESAIPILSLGTTDPTIGPEHSPPPAPLQVPPITLFQFSRQYKGMAPLNRYLEAYRDLLRAAQAGQTTEAIVEEVRLQGEGASDSSKSLRSAVSRLLGLGMLQREGDLFRPTDEGMRVLDGDDDPLVEQLLVRVYGFAQVLRTISSRRKASRAELYGALRAGYASWTSNFGPSGLLAWTKDLGLVEDVAGGVALTSYGDAWHARLPHDLPEPDGPDGPISEGIDGSPIAHAKAALQVPAFDEIERKFRDHPSAAGFVFDSTTLRALHAAWTCNPVKHFVILSGLSGTGKTAVLRHYARAICEALSLPESRHVQLVAVSPDWHDPSGLLGYFNPLHEDPTYQIEPALRLVIEAANDPSSPYFLILDEMNLARVERYMAPFLSAMETGGDLALHASLLEVNGVPPRVRWPSNLFLGGTVNMDESTHPFSDKVLDRAFTLEFWAVDLPTFFDRRKERHPAAEAVLHALNEALRPARRHFGYRTAGEVIDFVRAMGEAGGDERDSLDQAIFAKVLPKLRGEDDAALRSALEKAREVVAAQGMTRSAEKLALMHRRLADTGVTRFWS